MRFTAVLAKITKEGVGEYTVKQSNLPKSYVRRVLQSVEWSTPRGYPQYLPKKIVHKKTHYGVDKPWGSIFQKMNEPGRRHTKVFLEPVKEWTFYIGDRVEILDGPDKGKQGIVAEVIEERNWVLVEGLNLDRKVMGKSRDYPGSVVAVEKPLLINQEVALIDPSDLLPTKVEWRYTEDGEKVRVSNRTGRIIPLPNLSRQTNDYKTKSTYKESAKDTTDDEVSKITFDPKLSTFEMDVLRAQGIEETRTPTKTYWY